MPDGQGPTVRRRRLAAELRYSDTMQPWFATYVGLEAAASEIRNFEIDLIPGL